MLTPQQTWSSIAAHVYPLPTVTLPLHEALGHVLAEDILADRDLPAADRSAMDGIAVRAEDVAVAPVSLTIVGEVPAGVAPTVTVIPGSAARIYTGGNIPAGADTVIRVEDTTPVADAVVRVDAPGRHGANVLRQGEHVRRGDVVVRAGTLLGGARLTACAAVGRAELSVVASPSAVVITSGRELLDPRSPAADHQERDSNQIMIASALRGAGVAVVAVHRVCDDRAVVAGTLRTALAQAEAVVLSGGVSVGAYDFVPAAVTDVGARTLVHGVAMKPGKPFLFALTGQGKPIFGLPGNPLSAATALHEFVLPALRCMAGWSDSDARPTVRARLREALPNKPGRARYVLGALTCHAGTVEVTVVPSQSSADVIAAAGADGAIIVPAIAGALEEGALVDFRPWRSWP